MPYNPEVSTRLSDEDLVRFLSNAEARDLGYTTPCSYWTKGKFREGYAAFGIDGKTYRAHRLIWAHVHGRQPEATLDHLCHDPATCDGGWDCPHRACVNTQHLAEKSIKDNVLRGGGPSAANATKTHCDRGHEYTPENTYVWEKTGWRQCKTCRAADAVAFNKALTGEDRDAHNAKRRARRKRITYDPRPCSLCGTVYQPLRATSRFCTTKACINERQRISRDNRLPEQ